MLSCVSPVASHTFYSAHSEVPELTPHSGPDDNTISFAHLDTGPDSQLSGMGPADELAGLNVSAHTSEGFDLSWEIKPPAVYDSLVVECRGSLQTLAVTEERLSGDSTHSRVRGLNASTEYRVTLHGVSGSNRSLLLEAVAVTGTGVSLGAHVDRRPLRSVVMTLFWGGEACLVVLLSCCYGFEERPDSLWSSE